MPGSIGPAGNPSPLRPSAGQPPVPAWLDQANDAVHQLRQALRQAPADTPMTRYMAHVWLDALAMLEAELWAVGRRLGVLP